jgi:hypothetical protein
MHNAIVNKEGVLAPVSIFPIYSEKLKDKVFFNCAADKRYLAEFMDYLGFNIPSENTAYYHTQKGGILNLGRSDLEEELDVAMKVFSSCPTEEEGMAKLVDYIEKRKKELEIKNNRKQGTKEDHDLFENLRGRYITEEAFEELTSLVESIISLIQQDEENPERTNNIMSLIQNNYISEQIKNKRVRVSTNSVT